MLLNTVQQQDFTFVKSNYNPDSVLYTPCGKQSTCVRHFQVSLKASAVARFAGRYRATRLFVHDPLATSAFIRKQKETN